MERGMEASSDECARALSNIRAVVDSAKRFPVQVLSERWDSYFFFDSDRMFSSEFIDRGKELLASEGASTACILNLDWEKQTGGYESACFHRRTSPKEYMAILVGDGPEHGWAFGVDRLACMSEVGHWLIYVEKANEIAVLAIQRKSLVAQYAQPIQELEAVNIEKALSIPLSYGFSNLPSHWREALIKEYM